MHFVAQKKICDSSDLNRPDLKNDLEESVESMCDTRSRGEEESLIDKLH